MISRLFGGFITETLIFLKILSTLILAFLPVDYRSKDKDYVVGAFGLRLVLLMLGTIYLETYDHFGEAYRPWGISGTILFAAGFALSLEILPFVQEIPQRYKINASREERITYVTYIAEMACVVGIVGGVPLLVLGYILSLSYVGLLGLLLLFVGLGYLLFALRYL